MVLSKNRCIFSSRRAFKRVNSELCRWKDTLFERCSPATVKDQLPRLVQILELSHAVTVLSVAGGSGKLAVICQILQRQQRLTDQNDQLKINMPSHWQTMKLSYDRCDVFMPLSTSNKAHARILSTASVINNSNSRLKIYIARFT